MIRVVTTDLETGESDTAEFDNDYVLVCAGRCYLHHTQVYPGVGTTILTIKTDREDDREEKSPNDASV